MADGIKLLNTETEKVLGLIWRPQNDVFTFKVQLDFIKKGKQTQDSASISSHNEHYTHEANGTETSCLGI